MIDRDDANRPDPAPRARILLVDDHDVGRRSLAKLLDAMGFDVTAVADGASALESLVGPSRFDVVLTDVRLPDLDGREIVLAAHRVVPTPRTALITGWDVEPGEQERLGIDWVFYKPVDIRDLVDKIGRPTPAGH